MGLNAGIVVDSTFDRQPSYYSANNVMMVPLRVIFGQDRVYKEWLELMPDEFFKMLNESEKVPKTSQPPAQEFIDTYNKLKERSDFIVSLHLPENLSGTIQSARLAADEVDIPVHIFDLGTVSVGSALILEKVLEVRETTKSKEDFLNSITKTIEKQNLLGMLDTLDYLEKGGRIGKAQALVGSLLNFKPLLTVENGVVTPLGRARGKKKAFKELLKAISERNPAGKETFISFGFCEDDSLVKEFKNFLKTTDFTYTDAGTFQIGPVIGTYLGPRTLMASTYSE